MMCIDHGADIIGLNFYPKSPRYLEPKKGLELCEKLPTFVDIAGVLVNPDMELVRDLTEDGLVNWVQLHGDETPEFCDSINWQNVRVMKALRIKQARDTEKANDYFTDAVLLDAFHPDVYGGSGTSFDWSLLQDMTQRVFLAGGINPDNAVEAVRTGVYGIDLCSGLESEPGKKDPEKVKKLFSNIQHL